MGILLRLTPNRDIERSDLLTLQAIFIWTAGVLSYAFVELLSWLGHGRRISSWGSPALAPIYAKFLSTRKVVWVHSRCERGAP